jgi:heat shock protein HslJ
MRRLIPLTLCFTLAACAATGSGGPVLPGLVNAPPPPMAAEDSLPLGVVWSWQMTQMSDGAVIVPDGRDRYTLEFRPGGTVSVRADCNRGSATYVRSGSTLGIGPIALTRMACPADTRDAEFLKGLGAVSGHLIRGNDLVLTFKVDSGSMQFTSSRP